MNDYFNLQPLNPRKITAYHIGSVEDVIQGRIDPRLEYRRFSAENFQVGFEAGSPLNFQALGEAILVNGQVFSTCTDTKHQRYAQLVCGSDFVTSGLFAIPLNQEPNFHLQLQSTAGYPLQHLYQQIYDRVAWPVAFCGWMKFNSFHANFIEKPPIAGQNIFSNRSDYYSRPPILCSNEYGFVVGVLADFHDLTKKVVNEKLKTVLYHNPVEQNERLAYHAHVLTLDPSCRTQERISQEQAKECLHLFCNQTVVKQADLKIFMIENVEDYLK